MREDTRHGEPPGRPAPEASEPRGAIRRVLADTGLVAAGLFRCPREHPLFRDSGPILHFVAAFPRTSGCVRFEGGRSRFVSPEVAPLYNRGQRYVRAGLNRRGDRTDWIALTDRDAAVELAVEFDPAAVDRPDAPLPAIPAPVSSALYARQRFLIEALRSGPPLDSLAFEEEAIAIFREVVRSACAAGGGSSPRSGGGAESEAFLRARMAVEDGFRRPMLLSTIASRAGMSAVHLSRVFRRHTGSSVHRTVTALRLRESLERLRDDRTEIGDLALDLGFFDHSHFTSVFRRAFGMTPSQARRRLSRGARRDLRARLEARHPHLGASPRRIVSS